MSLSNDIGFPVSSHEIDRSHRVGKPNPGKPRAIIVKLATYRVRQRIYMNRIKLRHCGHAEVYVNEDLTKPRAQLLFEPDN